MRLRYLRSLGGTLLILAMITAHGHFQAQSSSGSGDVVANQRSQSVLRATTRLVILDVVATSSKKEPVVDLTRDDFTVLEDGKAQKVSDFAFHRPSTTQTASPLPSNVISNASQYSGNSSVNVILLDAANTDFSSHAYAQEMLIKYLESSPVIQPTAVYALENRLHLLHDFTTDTKALRDALAHYKPQGPTHLETTEAMASPFGHRGSFQTTTNSPYVTMSAIHFLARALGGFSGRKNLLWVSEAFPFALFPDTAAAGGSLQVNTNNAVYEEIANELMNAQVAVYPIDAAGVTKNDRFDAQTGMAALAERTGGKTYFRRNDIDVGVRTSLDDGSVYYTLEYYPENKVWDAKFRNIEVKVSRPDVKLEYRRGYYAQQPNRNNPWANYDFSQALSLEAPTSSAVLFQAAVVPPSEKTQNKVLVNFAIDAHSLAFEKGPDDLQRAEVNCVVWAYPPKGDPIRSEGTIKAAVKEDVYQLMLKSYLSCQRMLDLGPGHYTLRLAVFDRTTNLIGTNHTQITVP